MQKPRSGWLLFFSLWVLICGLAIVGLGAWSGNKIEWNELSLGIVVYGAAMVFISILGIMSSKGCTCCCNIFLYVFVLLMGVLVVAQTLVIVVSIWKESDWIADLAKKHTSGDKTVDYLKKKYDEFWPYFIGFGAVTAFGSVGAFFAAFTLLGRSKTETRKTRMYVGDNDGSRDVEAGVRRRHREVGLQMSQKYGSHAQNIFNKGKKKSILADQD